MEEARWRTVRAVGQQSMVNVCPVHFEIFNRPYCYIFFVSFFFLIFTFN